MISNYVMPLLLSGCNRSKRHGYQLTGDFTSLQNNPLTPSYIVYILPQRRRVSFNQTGTLIPIYQTPYDTPQCKNYTMDQVLCIPQQHAAEST